MTTMHSDPTLVLRGIHQPPAPSWWPPAPGWWLVAAIVLIVCGLFSWWAWRRRQRRRALEQLFDTSVQRAQTPALQVAAISELLRRAARRQDPAADKLLDEDWLRFLDKGLKPPVFANDVGTILRDGAFRRDVSASDVEALRTVARARFLQWMDVR